MKLFLPWLLLCPFLTFSQSINFCIGSCAEFTGETQDSIFYIVPDSKPDFFLWLGDNIYSNESQWGDFKSMKTLKEITKQIVINEAVEVECPF